MNEEWKKVLGNTIGIITSYSWTGCCTSRLSILINSSYFLDLHFFVTKCIGLYLIMTTTEMIMMKCVYISKFSRIAAINENFITTTLTSFNILIITINLILHFVTKELETSTTIHFKPAKPISNLWKDVQKNVKW